MIYLQSRNRDTMEYCYAKSLESCPTLCDPHRRQPTRLLRPWDSPGKNTGVGCHFLLQCMKVKSESVSCSAVSDSVTPRTVAQQAPLSMGILQARILEWVACPAPGDLPNPGIKPTCPVSPALAGQFFTR